MLDKKADYVKRARIDWEAIAIEYSAGLMTIAEIAAAHKIAISSISLKVKQKGWTRNLAPSIRALTQAKVAAMDVSEIQIGTGNVTTVAEMMFAAIDKASDISAGVVRRHRTYINDAHVRVLNAERLLDGIAPQTCELKDLVTLSASLRALIDARAKLMLLERQSYNLDDKGEGAAGGSINISF